MVSIAIIIDARLSKIRNSLCISNDLWLWFSFCQGAAIYVLSSTLLSTVTPPDGPIKFNQSYDVLKYISNQYHRYRLPFIVSHKDAHLNIIRSNQEMELNQPTGCNKNLHENQPNRIMPTILNSVRHWDFCDSHALINSWSGYISAGALFGFHDVTLWSIVHLWWLSVLWKTF